MLVMSYHKIFFNEVFSIKFSDIFINIFQYENEILQSTAHVLVIANGGYLNTQSFTAPIIFLDRINEARLV